MWAAMGAAMTETRICRKCEKEKPITSFPRRYGRSLHLRELMCGMCKKQAHATLHPEAKQIETWRARSRKLCVTLSEYLYLRVCRARRRGFKPLRVRKNYRIHCPLLIPSIEAARSRSYYHSNLTKSREKVKRWRRNNPAKRSAQHFRERVRRAAVQQDLSEEQWGAIKRAYRHRCAYCSRRRPLTQDHVVPVSKGGRHTASNIVPACRSCNSSKGASRPKVIYQEHLIGSSWA